MVFAYGRSMKQTISKIPYAIWTSLRDVEAVSSFPSPTVNVVSPTDTGNDE
jgi:hypothetical protein